MSPHAYNLSGLRFKSTQEENLDTAALDVELGMTRRELVDAHARIDRLEHRAELARPAVQRGARPWVVMTTLVIGAIMIALVGWLFARISPKRMAPDPDTELIEPAPAPAPTAAFDPDTELACPLGEPYTP